MSRKTGKPLKKELRDYQEAGVTLWLDGHPSTPKKIVKAHKLAENGVYMRDYVENEKGEIAKLKFDFVKTKK
ncbi:hypothetical protein [Blautia hydrogenotrophica]|uniref:Uncharacterized protein n=2 Tax=Blautia hydrogenotrophica TaxID=53443 RepID=C0CNQ7_BLAHS|nr:hypothetical protein [Blautia hydrogenotrophica]SCI05701.1 Uncharacterised protein [uncultured Blautia sp.]EEG48605.1 hypothetical protein RUMHYD_02500 [Blautia hydrogenotrophica DSM 10507]MCT6796186.1 hypothetical protein [Blautia hydrogenotrophica]MEE0462190.1 hypothetical protein [Blautia hydrogenotrophica]WPX82776.1 hypothetical protein BLHYD_07610 [Blautia hydrogenotrophica DSM 10507]